MLIVFSSSQSDCSSVDRIVLLIDRIRLSQYSSSYLSIRSDYSSVHRLTHLSSQLLTVFIVLLIDPNRQHRCLSSYLPIQSDCCSIYRLPYRSSLFIVQLIDPICLLPNLLIQSDSCSRYRLTYRSSLFIVQLSDPIRLLQPLSSNLGSGDSSVVRAPDS